MDLIGLALQAATLVISLTVTYLLSKKNYEKWGWIVGFWGLFVWAVLEAYYREWLYFVLNPVYFWIYAKGYLNHKND